MSFYEECLTLGQYLSQSEKVALYQFLLASKSSTYRLQAEDLLKAKILRTVIADGAISYRILNNSVSYECHRVGSDEIITSVRELNLGKIHPVKVRKLKKFFAQAEVDVLSNFPLPGADQNPDRGYTLNSIPYYDLNYFSNGRGKILGFVKKREQRDTKTLMKLRAL